MNKVEITNELLARIYGAYIGCDYQLEYDSVTTGERVVSHQDFSIFSLYMHHPADDRPPTSKLLIKLTPLSAITNEDADSCKSIVFNYSGYTHISNVRYVVENIVNACDSIYPMQMAIRLSDYLRSKGYDCGFAHIPSLIEAGIAIEKALNIKN